MFLVTFLSLGLFFPPPWRFLKKQATSTNYFAYNENIKFAQSINVTFLKIAT